MKYLKHILAAVFMCLFLCGCGEKEIKPMDYYSVTFDGRNGDGTAYVQFDTVSFLKDLEEAIPAKRRMQVAQSLLTVDLDDFIKGTVDPQNGLSNGDTVTLDLSFEKDVLKKSGKVIFTGDKTKTFTVSGLKEAEVIDAFDPAVFDVDENTRGVHLNLKGRSPLMWLEITNDADPQSLQSEVRYTYSVGDQTADDFGWTVVYFDKDDEVVIHADSSRLGEDYVLKEETKTITFPDAPEYLTSLDQISEKGWDELYALMKDIYDENSTVNGLNVLAATANGHGTFALKTPDECRSIDQFDFEGIYLVTLKSGKNYSDYADRGFVNELLIPIHAVGDYSNVFGDEDDLENYWAIQITDPALNSDGTLVLDSSTKEEKYTISRYGYLSLEEMKNDTIPSEDRDVIRVDFDMSRVTGGAPAASAAPESTSAEEKKPE